MNSRDALYRRGNSLFYEVSERTLADNRFSSFVAQRVDAAWRVATDDLWATFMAPHVDLRRPGFIVVVSTIPETALDLLAILTELCIPCGHPLRIVRGADCLAVQNSKIADQRNACCFAELGPLSAQNLQRALSELHRRTAQFRGPLVPHAKRYADSTVLHYRFGTLEPARSLQIDGEWYDRRAIDASLAPIPPDMSDPIAASEQEPVELLLGGRYRLTAAIATYNCGGVYVGLDEQTGQDVIVKEARPCTGHLVGDVLIDSMELLAHEHKVLGQLQHIDGIPKAYGIVDQWDHRFLILERIAGVGLRRFFAINENVFLPIIGDPGQLARFVEQFRSICSSVLSTLATVHREGFAIGNVCTFNVMVTESNEAVLVDLKAAQALDQPLRWPCVRDWRFDSWPIADFATRESRIATDIRDAGIMALSMLTPSSTEAFFLRQTTQWPLDWLQSLGVPDGVLATITSLLGGDGDAARRHLSSIA